MKGAPPLINSVSRPWWDALAREELALQRCLRCRQWVFYPRSFCPHCAARELEWQKVESAATLYTYSVAEVPVSPHFTHCHRPILAVAELDVGVRVPTMLLKIAPEEVRIGMALEAVFDRETYEGVTLLCYRPVR